MRTSRTDDRRLGNEADPDDEAPELDTRPIWAGLFFSLAAYAKFPQLDLMVSARYFEQGAGFIHRNDPMVRALYLWSPWAGRALVLGLFMFAVLSPLIARLMDHRGRADLAERCRGPWRHMAVVAVCCVALGNGLVIEGVFKNFMGRPRPVQVVQFGGDQAFHGPFEPGDDPAHHRSFVSSHAAAGFALISLGLTCGHVWRRRWLLIGVVSGSIIGAGRIMQGGHYLSDIIFAFYAIWLSCVVVEAVDRRRQQRTH